MEASGLQDSGRVRHAGLGRRPTPRSGSSGQVTRFSTPDHQGDRRGQRRHRRRRHRRASRRRASNPVPPVSGQRRHHGGAAADHRRATSTTPSRSPPRSSRPPPPRSRCSFLNGETPTADGDALQHAVAAVRAGGRDAGESSRPRSSTRASPRAAKEHLHRPSTPTPASQARHRLVIASMTRVAPSDPRPLAARPWAGRDFARRPLPERPEEAPIAHDRRPLPNPPAKPGRAGASACATSRRTSARSRP